MDRRACHRGHSSPFQHAPCAEVMWSRLHPLATAQKIKTPILWLCLLCVRAAIQQKMRSFHPQPLCFRGFKSWASAALKR